MSVSEASQQPPRWVILYRSRVDDPWLVHKHHKGTPFHFASVDNTVGDVGRLRRRGLQAMAVREDRCFAAYGIVV